jgi:hypothetical protein
MENTVPVYCEDQLRVVKAVERRYQFVFCVIPGVRLRVNEIYALLGFYAA